MNHVAVVLAAGQGTRMNCDLPKVLHTLAGRTMLGWVLEAVGAGSPTRTVVVVGHRAEQVRASLPSGVEAVEQQPQLGTGHAVAVALADSPGLAADAVVLVAYGDVPLARPDVYHALLREVEAGAAAAVATASVEDPAGFGRILRDEDGGVAAIVEDVDADPEQRSIREINAGLCAFRAGELQAHLSGLKPTNRKGELYLTDVIGALAGEGKRVSAVEGPWEELMGVNSHYQLARAEARLRERINRRWMENGVRMVDPDRTYVDHDVVLEPGVVLYPGTHLTRGARVESGAVVGPDTFVESGHIGREARVWYSVLREARVGAGCQVGPFASLRPGTELEEGSKAGTFVEMKNTVVGKDAKVPHLAYLGDATVGPRANVGAGTITCNYDGYSKHRTEIGADAFIGSDTMLVAPVKVGEGAVTGAGSVITRDVGPGELAVERSEQRNVPGYRERREARYRKQSD
ncbi:MAG: bifunctional protein GlmU [Acidimicrobiia bacterium]|nr:MAG: bifunctional protein GlmU [Acidimicrobiia bacterium]